MAAISAAKDELLSPDDYALQARGISADAEGGGGLPGIPERQLRENNALDFDDLIVKTVELFQKHARKCWNIIRSVSGISWWMSIRIRIQHSLSW